MIIDLKISSMQPFRVTLTLPFPVQGNLMFLVNLLMTRDVIHCMFVDLHQISSTATFLCDPDLDFSCSRSLNIFG